MYLIFGPCPQCGAPIFMTTTAGTESIVDLANGLWRAVPDITYSCKCLVTVPEEVREVLPPTRPPRRTPYGQYSAFGTGPRERVNE